MWCVPVRARPNSQAPKDGPATAQPSTYALKPYDGVNGKAVRLDGIGNSSERGYSWYILDLVNRVIRSLVLCFSFRAKYFRT